MFMYISQKLQGHLSVVQSLISFMKYSSEAAFLIALGTKSQSFGPRENMIFLPKYKRWHLLFRVESFFWLKGISAK